MPTKEKDKKPASGKSGGDKGSKSGSSSGKDKGKDKDVDKDKAASKSASKSGSKSSSSDKSATKSASKPTAGADAGSASAAAAAAAAPPPQPPAAPPIPNACESCGKVASVEYCQDCDRLYCGPCSGGAHAAPDAQTHRRGAVAEAALLRQRCAEHPSQTLRYYCESCRQPCCAECRAVGAHQGLAHVCAALAESFRTKRAELQHLVGGVLHARRDALSAALRQVEERVAAVRAARGAIERDTRAEYEAVLDRLSATESRLLAMLSGDLAALQQDLDACAALEQRIAAAAEQPVQLLLRFEEAAAACERAAARPLPAASEVRLDTLPREVEARRAQLRRAAALGPLLRVKDAAVAVAVTEATQLSDALAAEQQGQREAAAELQRWQQLAQRSEAALRRLDCACHFCGVLLSENSVNTACRRNTRIPAGTTMLAGSTTGAGGGLSSTQPPLDVFGTGRHFFVSVDKARISFA